MIALSISFHSAETMAQRQRGSDYESSEIFYFLSADYAKGSASSLELRSKKKNEPWLAMTHIKNYSFNPNFTYGFCGLVDLQDRAKTEARSLALEPGSE